jgi:hypothetical protein
MNPKTVCCLDGYEITAAIDKVETRTPIQKRRLALDLLRPKRLVYGFARVATNLKDLRNDVGRKGDRHYG